MKGAPTVDGTVSFVERAGRGRMMLPWAHRPAARTPLRWVPPVWARGAPTDAGPVKDGTVRLHDETGTTTVRFAGYRPARSYARMVHALNATYRAHG